MWKNMWTNKKKGMFITQMNWIKFVSYVSVKLDSTQKRLKIYTMNIKLSPENDGFHQWIK